MTIEQMQARIAELEAEKANRNAKGTGLRVSPKGGVSFYGAGRFPVTLYKSQWELVLSKADEIRAFIAANDAVLATKAKPEDKTTDTPAV